MQFAAHLRCPEGCAPIPHSGHYPGTVSCLGHSGWGISPDPRRTPVCFCYARMPKTRCRLPAKIPKAGGKNYSRTHRTTGSFTPDSESLFAQSRRRYRCESRDAASVHSLCCYRLKVTQSRSRRDRFFCEDPCNRGGRVHRWYCGRSAGPEWPRSYCFR